MSETATMAQDAASRIGPGRLVLVVGPSGAGKDTLLRLARVACIDDHDIVFPRRIVTRESSVDEDNVALGPDEFRRAREHGDFAVHWEAHGHSYALPREINDDIRAGRTVVANVSRTVICEMRRAYAWVPLGAGLGLYAMLGVGPGADTYAHLFGLGLGALIGSAAALANVRAPRTTVQMLLGAAALGAVVSAWVLALHAVR